MNALVWFAIGWAWGTLIGIVGGERRWPFWLTLVVAIVPPTTLALVLS